MKYLILVLIFLLPTTAHAKMINGKLISLKDATILKMGIQKKMFGSKGKIEAKNPKTGEVFAGEYIAIRQAATGSTFNQAYDNQGNAVYGSTVGSARSNVVPTQATLIGDKQTVIQCQFTIQAGFSPHGAGQCQDNRGESYSLQF